MSDAFFEYGLGQSFLLTHLAYARLMIMLVLGNTDPCHKGGLYIIQSEDTSSLSLR